MVGKATPPPDRGFPMDRRTLLKTGALAGLGLGLGGCVTRTAGLTGPSRARLTLPTVRASWDRVIRTTVGLRPHRPSGFVLKTDRLDAKTLIHNYGHGGSGMSLSWGTGSVAADYALEQESRRAAVIGCGAVGLTTARQLQRRGFERSTPSRCHPTPPRTCRSLASRRRRVWSRVTGERRHGMRSSRKSWRSHSGSCSCWTNLRGPAATARWTRCAHPAATIRDRRTNLRGLVDDSYSTMDEVRPPRRDDSRPPLLPAHLRGNREILEPGEHPFPLRYATRQTSLRIEPSIYLDALVRDFLLFDGRLVIRTFDTPRDLMTLGQSLIVNCTGLGARDLFDDRELTPVKGQLTHLVPQSEVNFRTSGGLQPSAEDGGIGIHMMPRSDGIALGGTAEEGVWTLEPNETERQRIVDEHIELYAAMA